MDVWRACLPSVRSGSLNCLWRVLTWDSRRARGCWEGCVRYLVQEGAVGRDNRPALRRIVLASQGGCVLPPTGMAGASSMVVGSPICPSR